MRILRGRVRGLRERRRLRNRNKSNMIKRRGSKEKINIFLKKDFESKLNDFINQIEIKQLLDDEDQLFNELKNKENKIINEIIMTKKYYFKILSKNFD